MNEPMVATAAAASTSPATATTTASNTLPYFRMMRLWRGVETMFIGCIPAHALYFSSYEMVKAATLDPQTHQVTTYGASLAGAAATLAHDSIMTPLDTVKQRLQLGHYDGVAHALRRIVNTEGAGALYKSFPVTIATNVPYGMIMVTTHETLKNQDVPVVWASSTAGFLASALTTPFDVVKTRLQTQNLEPACFMKKTNCPMVGPGDTQRINLSQAIQQIWREQGPRGFFRGLVPRVLSHTPAVTISWTTYEVLKQQLTTRYGG